MEKGWVPFLQIFQPKKDALVLGRQKGVVSLGLGAPCATQTEKWEVGSQGWKREGPLCAWPFHRCPQPTCISRVPACCPRALEHDNSEACRELMWHGILGAQIMFDTNLYGHVEERSLSEVCHKDKMKQ